ncbi:hypothetical protein GCM10009760_61630 [Kitasatospora kazusensis]|uniref:Protein kinase domain-containing protein n=1 Tax=Kitasatospora kazusensis TaxID=407974 RepID=A0ABN3ABV8_9ACTN
MTTEALQRQSERISVHGTVSQALAEFSDAELCALVTAAKPLGRIGKMSLTELAGHTVFIKRIPLTELEQLPENVGSTANLQGLPLHSHYGIGSDGLGAWRESALHDQTTAWVLNGEHDGFPLTFHTRVLPISALPRSEIAAHPRQADIVVFLENVPLTLADWMRRQAAAGSPTLDRAITSAAAALEAGVAFMGSRGLVHFDTHRANILTDGTHFYIKNYSQALSRDFTLTDEERDFHRAHADYDWMLTFSELVNVVGDSLQGLGDEALAVIQRYAPVAARAKAFFDGLANGPEAPPFPTKEISTLREDAESASIRRGR